ncbi:MAG: NAD(P)H-hydrate dehydratase [Desulfobacteraceae bacterium]|nr:NAD(P)H-hydrate dehydratase [Desulfobacteraceae bacterium]
MKISRVSEMREMDRTAVEKFGIAEELLMENAGHAAYDVLLKEFGIINKKFVIFCGIGNNGGDGFVIARKIHSNGGQVKVFIIGDRNKFKGAAKTNLDIVSRLPIQTLNAGYAEAVKNDLCNCDAVVDAIFGTGLARDVGGVYRDIIELVSNSGKTVLSLDIPSGIHGDTGQVMGVALKADYTVTFGLPKIGNILFPGYERCGKLFVTYISFPQSVYKADSLKIEINNPVRLPKRNRNGHKGDFGEVLFIAGASGYFGAPYLAAMSFLKAGGGYSRLAAPASVIPHIGARGNEIVFIPQKETSLGGISLENKNTLLELSEKMDMIVLGPGLSLDEETQQIARELAKETDKPLLIDGDGITALCKDLNIIRQRKADTILTPHMGEMSRITNMGTQEISVGKTDILQRVARDLNSIIVLKGAHSLIGYPDESVFINMSGNSGMATAGSGDVLAGTIAGMFGLGLSVSEAVKKGVFIHGLSGDIAARDKGEDGITARDILDCLPSAVKADREGIDEYFRERYVGAHVV